MNDFRKILTDFAKHLNESGQLKKGTAIADEVKYYLENKAKNLPVSDFSDSTKKCNSNTSRCKGFSDQGSFCPQCEYYH